MVLMMVMLLMFIFDEREDGLHQVKIIDPSHHHQHLVYVVWSFLVVAVI